jgi:hypothetical protein
LRLPITETIEPCRIFVSLVDFQYWCTVSYEIRMGKIRRSGGETRRVVSFSLTRCVECDPIHSRDTAGFQYTATRQPEQFFENERGNHGAVVRDQTNKATNFAGYFEEQFNATETFALVLGGQFLYAGRSVSDDFLGDGDSSSSASFLNFSPKDGRSLLHDSL